MSKLLSILNAVKGTPPTKLPVKIKRYIASRKKVNDKRNQNLEAIKMVEEQYGVDFGGYIPTVNSSLEASEQCNGYEASYPMPNIFKLLNVKEGDRLLDVGSGKGYAMYLFSEFPFSKIDGVEINEDLVRISQENLNKLFPDDKDRFEVFCDNALTFARLENYNYIYMYNPFPREVVEQFARRLEESAKNRTGKLTVIYQNPQKGSVFEQNGVFKAVLCADGTAVFESNI